MSVIPVRIQLNELARYRFMDDAMFRQALMSEASNIASSHGLSVYGDGPISNLRTSISDPSQPLSIACSAIGRLIKEIVRNLELVPMESSLESADIEVLERIYTSVGAEIDRRGGVSTNV